MIVTGKAAHLIFSAVNGLAAGMFSISITENGETTLRLTSLMIAVAIIGSATAIVVPALEESDPENPRPTPKRRIVRNIIATIAGAFFGLIVGPSVAAFFPIDILAGIYFASLMGFGIIVALTAPKTIRAFAEFIIDQAKGLLGGSKGRDKE